MFVQPTEDGADSGAGVLLEYAMPSEEYPNGDFLLEAGYVSWEQNEVVLGYDVEGEMDLIPVLLAYRHRLPFGRESATRLEVGACVGTVYSRASVQVDDVPVYSANRWNFAWGLEAALAYRFSAGMEALVGYKYISADAGTVEFDDGSRYKITVDCHVLTAGIGWSW